MPLQIIRQDITKMRVDAIVNTTNEEMVGYSGVDLAVHKGAGPLLDKECRKLAPLGLGTAKITKGYNLDAKYIRARLARRSWEFLFIGANIDAVETAARYGIDRERAVNYNADKEGTRVMYESVARAVCSVRNCEALSEDWSADIDADYKKRSKKSR